MNQPAHATPSPSTSDAVASPAHDARVCDYFVRHLGEDAARLLDTIDGSHPAGQNLRGTPTMRAIEEARRSDDPTLPMGPWAVELKHANWPSVSKRIVDALCTRSKDLRLTAWLLEAEIHQRGFAALAPCIDLMREVCIRWWDDLHPHPLDGDQEPRANIVRWVNDKLLATLSLVPLVQIDEHVASWSGWELAHHHERIRAANGSLPEEAEEVASLEDLQALLAQVSPTLLRSRHAEIAGAREAIAALDAALREFMHDDAPTLHKMDGLLARMQSLLRGELSRRHEPLEEPEATPIANMDEAEAETSVVRAEKADDSHPATGARRTTGNREQAYRELAGIAEYLMQIEPHSPVPYLLQRAIDWGRLDAASLYHELFLKAGGQVSIFELMGLAGTEAVDEEGEGSDG
ncbi:type VI secretion system protein TssA [Oleiagrimonas sp. MCCC 1A03011]|uniref:type VI secretion system protein TssA n=1 Tax=Oleiagrimonas sp. MCCC 1A03011 TaxID=1926883 RepID=UPI000DD99E53|nr:type VI secretion system protein TssA [Oleiagrimonas sp. MCCC 1A03011]